MSASTGGDRSLLVATAARSSFFFWLSVLLLSFLLLGFAPTLYLHALTAPEPIPAYLHVHGVVLTSWYVWLVVQTWMVRTGRTATHRRLGVIGAVISSRRGDFTKRRGSPVESSCSRRSRSRSSPDPSSA